VSSAPTVELGAGELLIREGQLDAGMFVLSSGTLVVEREGRRIAVLDTPGTIVGEMAQLLVGSATADVRIDEAARLHRIDDTEALFRDHPDFGRHLAETLARRLYRVTSYLDDLRRQFDDRNGTLGLVPTVLEDLLGTDRPEPDPGSEREPDSPY
jgi:CRP-like cAMP-binding protein